MGCAVLLTRHGSETTRGVSLRLTENFDNKGAGFRDRHRRQNGDDLEPAALYGHVRVLAGVGDGVVCEEDV